MAKSIEKLADEIYKEALADGEPVTKEEALEMAKMELNAKAERNYTQEDVKKVVRKPRERKVDEEKGRILKDVSALLEGLGAENVIMKNEVEVSFFLNNSDYTIKLTKHRPPKK